MEEPPQLPESDHDNGHENGLGSARIGWPGAIAVASLCLLAGFTLYECSPGTQAGKLAGATSQVGQGLLKGTERLVQAMNEHHVTQTFREHLESAKPDLPGRLLLVESEAQESFTSADAPWWGVAMGSDIGTTTSEISVPVTYRYYVALNEPWELNVQVTPTAVLCEVKAPALKALPNPSPDLSRMEMKSANGWFRSNRDQVQADLLKDITESLNMRAFAHAPEHMPMARDGVEKYVRNWLLKEYNLPPNVPIYMKITFQNEPGDKPQPIVPIAPKG